MEKPLVFMMGQSPAILPVDRQYAKSHLWVMADGDRMRFGFSAYAVRLLGDMHHLKWSVAAGDTIEAAQRIGYVEASKATSDIYSPVGGRVERLNELAVSTPGLINSNLYDSAWLLEVRGTPDGLLDPEAYVQHLEATWPFAQRLLKGQADRNSAEDR